MFSLEDSRLSWSLEAFTEAYDAIFFIFHLLIWSQKTWIWLQIIQKKALIRMMIRSEFIEPGSTKMLRLSLLLSYFSNRVVKAWNQRLSEIKNARNVSCFKKS